MGLHLGWIPNEPGLRAREYAAPAPGVPDPDSPEAARLRAAHAARALWTRLLIVVGLLALALFGLVGTVSHAHRSWFWAVGVVLAVCCWLPLLEFALRRRRVARRRRRDHEEREVRHAAEVAEYQRGKAAWQHAEAERIAAAPRWLQVAAHEDITRLDVFGGTPQGRQSMLAGVGQTLLAERAVIVLDLSQDQVAAGLIAAARQAGISCQDYQLPRDLPATPLLAGLSGDEIASLIVEVLHADDANATAAGRATDLMILRKITRALGGDVTMSRLHEALSFLLADATNASSAANATGATAADRPLAAVAPQLSPAEQDGLHALFGASMRGEIGGNLIRLAAVLEPLAELGADDAMASADAGAAPRQAARLTCLSLPDGARDVAADLAAALIVQWATRSVADTDGFRPAVVLAGADEQSTRHLSRLTTVCERYEVPLVRMFSRLTEESSRHLDSRHTAFMRLATRPEALRAAEHIGLERKFIAGRFSHRQSVSQSRTRTSTESTTHTTGRAEGEATTHTTGTTTGEMYSEAKVPRHDNQIHIHTNGNGGGGSGSDESDSREQFRARVAREREAAAAKSERGSGRQPSGGGGKRDQGSSGGGWLSGGGGGGGGGARVSTSSGGKPAMDTIKTRTRFSAQHTSDSKTQSVTNTEETSHTRSESRSRTDGASVGDEITFELVYDHTVQPETLMALPENQMLAPHVVAGAPNAASLPAAPSEAAMPGGAAARVSAVAARPAGPESRMVALVIDPAVVGTDAVAPVSPHEIPAYEPPAPAVSSHVPDYERVPHAALGPGEPTRSR